MAHAHPQNVHPATGKYADGPDDGHVHAHISSVKFYVGILGALMLLTLLTVGIASIHLGPLNLAVAVVIASIKASLVVLFFMHLRYDNRFNGTIFICSLMFIGVFFAYTMNDTGTRAELDDAQGAQERPSTGEIAPGGAKGDLSTLRSHENRGSYYAPNSSEANEYKDWPPEEAKPAAESGEMAGEKR